MSKQQYIEAQRLKPIGQEGIDKLREIVSGQVESMRAMKINEVFVDSYSASAIIGVYDRLSESAKEQMRSLPVVRACDVSFKVLNRGAAA